MVATRNRRIRPVDGLVKPAVAVTLEKLGLTDADKAAARLAERYAAAIDDAAVTAADLADLAADVDPGDAATHKRLAALTARVEAHQVLVDLGPRLLACLESLGASPKARAALRKGGGQGGGGKLQGIREARGA